MPSTTDPFVLHRCGPLQRMRGCAAFAMAIGAVLATAGTVRATSLTVPDDLPTVQAALDAGVDSVLVQPGEYLEAATMKRRVSILGIPGAANSRPALGSLVFDVDGGPNLPVRIENLELRSRVDILHTDNSELPTVTFVNCHLKAGAREATGDPIAGDRILRRCRIEGVIEFYCGGALLVDSCDVEGLVRAQHDDAQVTVVHSRLRGSGVSADVGVAHVGENVFEQGTIAINVNSNAVIRNNHLLFGRIRAFSENGSADVSDNRLEHGGIVVDVNQDAVITGNVVLNSENSGVYVFVSSSATISGNLASGSARHGFHIIGNDPYRLDVSNNTSVFNHASGFVSDCWSMSGPYRFTGNIGARNSAHGVLWDGPEVTSVRSNDWFDNLLGDVQGRPPSGDDLAADPLFCDATNGDFRLSSGSPLVNAPGYGRVGALGVGCAAPGVFQDAFRLSRVGPNPSGGPVTIDFEMPRAATIEVDVFDIQGRLVASPARGSWPAGRHSVSWARTSAGAPIRPGLYLVRYRFPGGEAQRRIVRTP